MDQDKINNAYANFVKGFDEDDLGETNKNLNEILRIANFSQREKILFVTKVKKYMQEQHVLLDCMRTFY